MRPTVLVFDVNETLLDLKALRSGFIEVFGSAEPMGEWFARMLHGSLVANHVGNYRPFGQIGAEALMVLALERGLDVSPDLVAEIVERMRHLPPHSDVPDGLDRLRAAGFRLVTLTNGSSEAVADQLRNAGIGGFFERAFSVDAVSRFKPAPEPYLHVCAASGVGVDRAMLVAAHDWDIAGARAVGMEGCFLARPGVVWGLPDPPPDVVAADLHGLVDRLVEA